MSTSFSSFGLKAGWLHVWWALFLAPVIVASVHVVLAQEERTVLEPQVVVVQFEPGIVIGEQAAKTGLTAFDRTVARYQVEVIERAFPFLDYVEPTPKTAKNLAALRRTYYVRYRTETDPTRVVRALSAVQGILYAEPVLVNHMFDSDNRHIEGRRVLACLMAETGREQSNGSQDVCDERQPWARTLAQSGG